MARETSVTSPAASVADSRPDMPLLRRLRRSDYSPRVELMPLIDVVFLLLTFFIYSLVIMVQAEVLPVQLASVGTGQSAGEAAMHAVTIDKKGDLFFNRDRVSPEELDQRLQEVAADPNQPTLYLAVEAGGEVDRSQQLIDLLRRVQQAGVPNVAVVGQPTQQSP